MTFEKIGNEYVFTFQDDVTHTKFTARAKIGPGKHSINGDTLELFPERSSNHRRIIAFLEANGSG